MRHDSGEWLYHLVTDMNDAMAAPSLDCTLTLADVYQKVAFDDAQTDSK